MENQALLDEIETYCRSTGLSPSTVCLRAAGNGHLPKRLQSGGECLPRTMEKVRAYMRENPPKQAATNDEAA
tara:strand:+ start:2451 stop:2666 length:216 start_codon:yes stop_codon:yes gene_type:complete